jgi:hypothetical protein
MVLALVFIHVLDGKKEKSELPREKTNLRTMPAPLPPPPPPPQRYDAAGAPIEYFAFGPVKFHTAARAASALFGLVFLGFVACVCLNGASAVFLCGSLPEYLAALIEAVSTHAQ